MIQPTKNPKATHAGIPLLLKLAGLWLIYVVWCQLAGWGLSLIGSLNLQGYLAASPLAIGTAFWFWRATGSNGARPTSYKAVRRMKKLPSFAAWCGVAALILVGAVINPPSNYDGLTYRLPKILYWLQEGHWHWIDGIDYRLNITGSGFEWMSAPIILLTRGDRGLFLLNFIPFLLLPGLFFIAARGLGIRPRAARWWMWVWPMAYGIAVQAGSIGNDMVGGALAVTSLAFAAHARKGHPLICLGFSAVAAGCMTGIKVSMLPLGLPLASYWLWVAWKVLGPRRTVILGSLVAPLVAVCSFIPIGYLCWKNSGSWNGNPNNRYGLELHNPIAGIIGNGLELTLGALYPPVYPATSAAAKNPLGALENHSWFRWTVKNCPNISIKFSNELPSEEGAGIGLGVSLLALIWGFAGTRRNTTPHKKRNWIGIGFVLGTLIAILAFLARQGIGATPRLTVPYVPFLILSFLVIVTRGQKRRPQPSVYWAVIPALFLLPSLLLNPNRPLLPSSLILNLPGLPTSMKTRMCDVYSTYSKRGELFAPFRGRIPATGRVGFAGGPDHSSVSLFRPFGTRQVVNLSPRTQNSVTWVLATRDGLERRLGVTMNEWEQSSGFRKVEEREITSKVQTGVERWSLYQRIP